MPQGCFDTGPSALKDCRKDYLQHRKTDGPLCFELRNLFRPRVIQARLTAAVLPAVAFLVIVHGAVLTSFFAALRSRLCRKSAGTNRCRQNRKQNFGVIFHQASLVRDQQ
jgi:hypothetical protein